MFSIKIEVYRASEITIAVHFKTCHAKEVSATVDIRKIHFSESIVSLQFGFVVAAAIQHHQFCKTREKSEVHVLQQQHTHLGDTLSCSLVDTTTATITVTQ